MIYNGVSTILYFDKKRATSFWIKFVNAGHSDKCDFVLLLVIHEDNCIKQPNYF